MKIKGKLFLHILIGAYLCLLGFLEIYPVLTNEIASFFNSNSTLQIIIGIAEIAAGVALLLRLKWQSKKHPLYMAGIAVAVLWVAKIILARFIWGISSPLGQLIFFPDFYTWLKLLVTDLIVLAGIFVTLEEK